MENAPSLKVRIKSTAAYIAAAVLLIVLTVFARKIDGAYFSSGTLFKPAEMTVEAAMILFAGLFALKHRESGIMKRIRSHLIYIAVPLVTVFAARFFLPDRILPLPHNLIHILDIFLSAFSDDLVLCALGCILLIHKGGLKRSGVFIMLICMVVYEAVLAEETAAELVFSIVAVALLGFFEIQLHLSAESAVFCAVFHFIIRLCIELPAHNTAQNEPFFGSAASNALHFAALLTMLLLGSILYARRREKDLIDNAEDYSKSQRT